MGGKIETGINQGPGPPHVVISGQNYHRIGSLLPAEGKLPKFCQLYIYDTENELANRSSHFRLVQKNILFCLLNTYDFSIIVNLCLEKKMLFFDFFFV